MWLVQVHTSKLEADSFWVKANEEAFAKDDIFAGLIENFASKAPGIEMCCSRRSM